mgnify:CR=1 FL=1
MIAQKLRQLKLAQDRDEMLEIFSEIKIIAERKNYPTEIFKKQMLTMFYSSIEVFISERENWELNGYNSKILDTFLVLDKI